MVTRFAQHASARADQVASGKETAMLKRMFALLRFPLLGLCGCRGFRGFSHLAFLGGPIAGPVPACLLVAEWSRSLDSLARLRLSLPWGQQVRLLYKARWLVLRYAMLTQGCCLTTLSGARRKIGTRQKRKFPSGK